MTKASVLCPSHCQHTGTDRLSLMPCEGESMLVLHSKLGQLLGKSAECRRGDMLMAGPLPHETPAFLHVYQTAWTVFKRRC